MRIFELRTDANNYQNLQPVVISNMEIINNINLKKVADTWKPIEFKFFGKGKKGDCPNLIAYLPVLSERAINILNDLINDSVEYLPIICPGEAKFWGVNVLKSIDCIDIEKSKVIRFESGRIMTFKKYCFKKEMLVGVTIFKIPDLRNSSVFVSDEFVQLVKDSGLEGFEFIEVDN